MAKCACEVQRVDLKRDRATIVYCQIHKAAPKLIEIIEEVLHSANGLDTGDEDQMAIEVSKLVLEKAERLLKKIQLDDTQRRIENPKEFVCRIEDA